MKKQLLSIAMLAAISTSAMAHEIGDKVYSNSARFKITGKNLVTNGDFSDLQLGGWTATDESIDKLTTFSVNEGRGEGGSNTICVNQGYNALTNGIYQVVDIEQGGTYIVSMKVMNLTAAGFTDFDLTGSNINYINAYYNTDGALATADGTKLLYGTDGVCGGYTFSFNSEGFTTVNFPVVAPANGKIVIDLRALADGVEICDVTCQVAEQIYDNRIPKKRIEYIEKVLNSYDFTERATYPDLAETIDEIKQLIAEDAEDRYASEMENLENYWNDFTAECFSNVLNTINGGGAGNKSANWDNWTAKFDKMTLANNNTDSGWSWSTDRWCHKDKEAVTDYPLQIQWMRTSSGTWDNIATNTTTLDKGTYFFGVQGAGGMMTLNRDRWARSQAFECAETYLFFNNDTTDMFLLPTANEYAATDGNVIYKFEVAEDNTSLTFGIRCNIGQGRAAADGFDVCFWHPVLYKVLVEGELTPEQTTYLDNTQIQIDALKGRIKVAEDYLAETQTELPWGKEDLKAGLDETKVRLAAWEAMTQAERLETMVNASASYEATQAPYYNEGAYVVKDSLYQETDKPEALPNALPNLIMNAGVRYINNNFITPFVNKNAPLTDIPTAIETAKATKGGRLYSACDATALDAAIAKAQALYDEKLAASYSEETANALVAEKADLASAVDAFVASLIAEAIVDIDFSNPVKTEGEETPVYTIEGAKGTMVLPNLSAEGTESTSYQLGYNGTDYLDMLRVGKGDATVEITGIEPNTTDIYVVSYDMYYGNLTKRSAGTYLYSGEDVIAGLDISKYDGTNLINTFDVDYNGKITGLGRSGVADAALAVESNKTHIEYVLDYGDKSMYITTSGAKGTFTWATTSVEGLSAEDGRVYLDPAKPLTKFVLRSTYDNAGRRCWFDNLKVEKISANASDNPAVTGIADVTTATQNAAKAVKKIENGQIIIVKDGKKYNVAGAQVK